MFINGVVSYGQIKGTIISEDKRVVQYANVIVLTDSLSGTTTDEQGTFKLPRYNPVQLYISATGFEDTIVQANPFKENVFTLKGKTYQLRKTSITSSFDKPSTIGPFDALPQEDGWRSFYPGQSLGIFYEPTNKEIYKRINSIQVYISSKGIYNTPMGIRLLTPRNCLSKSNLTTSTSEFYDLLPETVTFVPNSPGWQNIDLANYSISMPPNGIIILFYPLDAGEQYRWQDNNKQFYYGSVLATSAYNAYETVSVVSLEKKIYITNSLAGNYKPMIVIKL